MTRGEKFFKIFFDIEQDVYILPIVEGSTKDGCSKFMLSIDLPDIKSEAPYFKNSILSKFALAGAKVSCVSIGEKRLSFMMTYEMAEKCVEYIKKVTSNNTANDLI